MTLNEYIDELVALAQNRPELGNATVIYAIDGEGNAFHPVGFSPSVGLFQDDEWISEDSYNEEPEEFDGCQYKVNAVCIN